jgi:hypothetical protein
MDDPAVFSFSDCPRILLALTKDWRAEDNSRETLARARTALAKLIYALRPDIQLSCLRCKHKITKRACPTVRCFLTSMAKLVSSIIWLRNFFQISRSEYALGRVRSLV